MCAIVFDFLMPHDLIEQTRSEQELKVGDDERESKRRMEGRGEDEYLWLAWLPN